MFVLPFRELNLIEDNQYSLHELLCVFHPGLKDLDPKIFEEHKVVFIFDGLDESRIALDFSNRKKLCKSDITMTSSISALMTNLFSGDLLPSARIWITCRPAAAHKIPPKYISRVTEIQGFNDPQKEEYFRKRISDQDQVQKIISHIKTTRSLHIMCHIPVFCWISSTVLQEIVNQGHTEIPKTLTEMYSHFLITQVNRKKEKYEGKDETDPEELLESNRTNLLKLAELAFNQLMKKNVMFYEEDLRECGIDVPEASVYSGVFTEIFREECVIYQRKVYSFVHLSFQEFLAAVYLIHCYETQNTKVLRQFEELSRKYLDDPYDDFYYDSSDSESISGSINSEMCYDLSESESSVDNSYRGKSHCRDLNKHVSLKEVLIGAVYKAIKSQTRHLYLFLRFLLGISLKSNQRLLQGLLNQTHTHSEEVTKCIKRLIKEQSNLLRRSPSTERAINMFLCLSEVNDQSLSREIQEYLQSENQSEKQLSPGQCSVLACMLLTSEEVLEELDLKKYNTSVEGYRRLIPAVTACRRAVLVGCNFTWSVCNELASVLKSVNSSLKELDLSENELWDGGVKLLSEGLKSSHCKLEKLRLVGCNFTGYSCSDLSSVLESVNSSLKELDLSENELRDDGVKKLSKGLKSSHCKLEKLRLVGCNFTSFSCSGLSSVLESVNSSLKELDLSENKLRDYGVKKLSDGLKSSHCKLEKLR
uniref:NACHT domain-containing protein n=1 Tax=Astyanax mexicanus TaxID=7994 RepID=A0A3B1K5P1_ASTMX